MVLTLYASSATISGEIVIENKTAAVECDCKDGYCDVEKGAVVCKCPPEYGKLRSTVCKKCDCGKEANCTWKSTFFWDSKTCLCKKGYEEMGGTCKEICITDDNCQSFEKCKTYGMNKYCLCPHGKSGKQCDIVDDCVSGKYKWCKDGNGQCAYKDIFEEAECDCGKGKKWNEIQDLCLTTCTTNSDCQITEKCLKSSSGDMFCECKPGRSGQNCEMIKDCESGKYRECKGNKGLCLYNDEKESAECDCGVGKKWDESKNLCRSTCNDDCKNSGECKGYSGMKFCECKPGTRGDFCETVDDCTKYSFCGYERNVTCVYNETTRGGECQCNDSKKVFDRYSKKCKTTCTTNSDCQSTEKCLKSFSGEMFCACKPGRSGQNCEIINDCESGKYRECKGDKGLCLYNDEKESAECDCGVGKKWDEFKRLCRIPCNQDCHNNARCQSSGDFKFCVCLGGTTGEFCETVVDCDIKRDFCGTKTDVKCIYNGYSSGKCDCHDPNKLFDTEIMECRVPCYYNCQNNGKCTDQDKAKFCRCQPGTSGDFCETVDNCTNEYCGSKEGVKCVYGETIKEAVCMCDNASKYFDASVKECRIPCKNDCANNGECEAVGEMKFCKCKPGTSGDFCGIVDNCESKDFCGTAMGVKCVYDENKNAGACKCDDTMKRFDTKSKKCRSVCDNDCANHGQCDVTGVNRFCRCHPGTNGDFCEIVDDCTSKDFCGTKADVKCLYDESRNIAACKCDDPTKRFDPKSKECRIPCKNNCANNGECEVLGELKFCKCKRGTSGDLCATVDDCAIKDFCGTAMGVICVYDENKNAGACKCEDPTERFDPKSKECRRGACTNYTCVNGGICAEVGGGAVTCYCRIPFSGERCEKGPCTDNPCRNGGTCVVHENGYKCNCKGHYFGKLCEMGPCTDNPCKNGGTCEVHENGYKCNCKAQYFGTLCEMDPCTLNPCQNGGTCSVDGTHLFKCTCTELFSGTTCEIDYRYIIVAVLLVIVASFGFCCGCCLFRISHISILRDSAGYKTLPSLP